MDLIIVMLEIAVLLAVGCLFLFRKILFSYSSKKGENLATKEDITEITNMIESVKLDHAKKLEETRAELSSQINNHGFRYEKEYEVLSELTECLVEIRNAALGLRPVLDYIDPSKSVDEIKMERLREFHDKRRKLFFVREKKRPFFPVEIYDSIIAIDQVAHLESIQYQHSDPFEGDEFSGYWKKAEENKKQITERCSEAMEKIRERVTKWELLSDGL